MVKKDDSVVIETKDDIAIRNLISAGPFIWDTTLGINTGHIVTVSGTKVDFRVSFHFWTGANQTVANTIIRVENVQKGINYTIVPAVKNGIVKITSDIIDYVHPEAVEDILNIL